MNKDSLAHGAGSRKDKKAAAQPGPRGAARFTREELAELAAFDAAIEEDDALPTAEERALSSALDRTAKTEGKEGRSGGPPPAAPPGGRRKAPPKDRRIYDAAYYRAHRAERLEYQRNYDAAHAAEISARRRARRAEKRKETDNGEDNNGRKI